MKIKVESAFPNTMGILGIVFITLKLCNVIDWSWWWVTLPFWGSLALTLVILIIFCIIFTIKLLKEPRK